MSPIPGPIEQLQRQLDEFRSAQLHRTKLPETLWRAAVELARQHGVYPSFSRCSWQSLATDLRIPPLATAD
jgi:hypothetical protein